MKFFTIKDAMIIITIVVLPLLIIILPDSFTFGLFYLGFYYCLLVFIGFVCVLLNGLFTIYGYLLIKMKKKNQSSNPDTAIIITKNSFFNLRDWTLTSYRYNFSDFFKLLELRKHKFKLHIKVTEDQFDKIIFNDKIRNIYIFGHGSRHALSISDQKPLYYCKYSNYTSSKDFIAQYHCNNGFGKSLADYVVKDQKKHAECEITESVWSFIGIYFHIGKKYREELKKTKKSD